MEESSQLNTNQTKRQWTPQEDAKLVEYLIELAATSWKFDNGTFKSGYAKQFERMINEKLPGYGLKANPHIESRVKMLKKHYFAIVEMMGPAASGFGWNDREKMIVVERDIYKEWVKSHPNAAGLYNKPFPHFEELGAVFGKDMAQGANEEDLAEAVTAMEAELETQLNDMQVNENINANLDDIEVEFEADSQEPQTPGAASFSSTQQKKKRKRDNKGSVVLDTLVDTVKEIKSVYQQQSTTMADLVSCFKHEKEGVDRRMKLMALLKDVNGLSVGQRMRAAFIIAKNNNLIDIIFSLGPEDVLAFVMTVLNES